MGRPYCHHCNNTGWVNCYCGGDLCVCENQGEEPCFACEGAEDDEFEDEYEESAKNPDQQSDRHD